MANEMIQIGLGEAIERLIKLYSNYTQGYASDDQKLEMKMVIEALNHINLDLGFDCDGDGIPDVPPDQIFKKSIETSCCRIAPSDTSRRSRDSSRKPSRKK